MTQTKLLKDISVNLIHRNPENPRIFFRQKEMDELTESIRKLGVQVPISVYKEGKRFVLLDGERRWRCSVKLNRPTIPAMVQEKPDTLTNLVLMFNIHALREQWDLFTIAIKLPRVIKLYEKKYGISPGEKQLAEETGLSRSIIRRCRLLKKLPQHHIDILRTELMKPKPEQKITEDFYIEMERALSTVSRIMPNVIPDDEEKERVRYVLLNKYKNEVINNIVDFRKIGKIARAGNVKVDIKSAEKELLKLFNSNNYSIQKAYGRSVAGAYYERDLKTHIESLIDDLKYLEQIELDTSLVELFRQLIEIVKHLMRGRS